MIILPAIDLKEGACVRLVKGDFDTTHKVAADALETAVKFAEAGAVIVHMVDLDGAKSGVRVNAEVVRAVAKGSGLLVEMGGGIRSMEDLEQVFELGVWRAVIGSAAVSDPDFVRRAAAKYGERIAVGVDCKDGRVMTSGWTENSGAYYLGFAKKIQLMGVKTLIYTDIDTDGTLCGPNIECLKQLRDFVDCDIIASGGVACNQDIVALRELGVSGAIIGKAYYAGRIDLSQAVRDGGEQCLQKG